MWEEHWDWSKKSGKHVLGAPFYVNAITREALPADERPEGLAESWFVLNPLMNKSRMSWKTRKEQLEKEAA